MKDNLKHVNVFLDYRTEIKCIVRVFRESEGNMLLLCEIQFNMSASKDNIV